MPEPSETSRDIKESRPDPSGFWHRKSQPVPTLACCKEQHLSELWLLNRAPGLPRSGQLHQIIYGDTAIFYGAVRSGQQGYPIRTTHVLVWRVP
eukprot:6174123-Pleurochrysis_carterae.AAC.1